MYIYIVSATLVTLFIDDNYYIGGLLDPLCETTHDRKTKYTLCLMDSITITNLFYQLLLLH